MRHVTLPMVAVVMELVGIVVMAVALGILFSPAWGLLAFGIGVFVGGMALDAEAKR